MKSLVMGLYFLSVSFGNLFTAAVNFFIQRPNGTSRLEGAAYYWFFSGAMLLVAFLFLPVVKYYKERTYIQDEVSDTGE